MGKMKDALIKLAKKVTGQEVKEKDSLSNVVEFMAENYEGGVGYTAGNGIDITNENVINADIKVLEVSNITALTTEQCESLNVGDIVVKLTSNQKHRYMVSYKEAGVGMCLTYVDASTSETVSYDFLDNAWVYNSTDITPLNGGGGSLYLHRIYLHNPNQCDTIDLVFNIYTPKAEAYTDIQELKTYLISAGLNNTAAQIGGNDNFNGILCTRIGYQDLSSVILRKISEYYDHDEWFINDSGTEQIYVDLRIAEDAVMTI